MCCRGSTGEFEKRVERGWAEEIPEVHCAIELNSRPGFFWGRGIPTRCQIFDTHFSKHRATAIQNTPNNPECWGNEENSLPFVLACHAQAIAGSLGENGHTAAIVSGDPAGFAPFERYHLCFVPPPNLTPFCHPP